MRAWYKSIIRKIIIAACCFFGFSSLLYANANSEGIQVYQKNMHLSPERKQILADDIDRYRNANDIWDSLRNEFTLPHYENNPLVQQKIQWFMEHQDYLMRSTMRAAPYLYYIMQQAKKRHLPAELVLLPIIESAYNPFALNASSGAAGIWQMMPGTASGYGIRQNWWYDGRRDVVASTKAALNHLAYLQSFFDGNWLLAIAAYDTGEGNVLAAIRKNIRAGENTDYWVLPLAQETRDYVPQLLALAIIISHPDQYPIRFPFVRNAPYLAQVDIGGQIDLTHAAYLAGLSLHEIKQLNPGYSRAATDPNGPYKIVLPIENVERFSENLSRSSPLYAKVNWVHYRIKNGDTLPKIAKRFNTTPSELHEMNPKLLAKNHLRPGGNIIIPRYTQNLSKTILDSEQNSIVFAANKKPNSVPVIRKPQLATQMADAFQQNPQKPYTMQPGDTIYMVRNNDDLEKIARRFHISSQALLTANQISNIAFLRPGEKLIIPTHSQPTAAPEEKYNLTPGDTIYVVRAGDTIEKIAKHFHTNPATIRLANLMADNDLHEGDQLVIPTHA